MQQRHGITKKQQATPTSSSKPELPTSEPPYEIIEFPSQQQYINTTQRNSQKSGMEKPAERKCDLCGCSNAQFFCDICVQQTFCTSCDQMYHRHPKRQKHTRKRIQQPLVEKILMDPPLPPKNELNQAPIPPPRRNKRASRTGTFNAHNQGSIKKNGSIMGSLKRFMGGIQSNTPQSTLNRNNTKSSNSTSHSSSTMDSDRQSGGRNFGYLDWNTDRRNRSGSFPAFNGPFPSLVQAQSMAQLNCPSCYHHGQTSSWDWNRSQMNLNALPPWTGLTPGNPWHGSIIIPPAYPMIPNDEFVRRDSFHSQRSARHRRPHKFHVDNDDSDFSANDDHHLPRKTKSPHPLVTASPALSRQSRQTIASGSEDEGTCHRNDARFKRRIFPTSKDCSPALSRRGFCKKYTEDDDAVSMKSVGSRRSVKSARSHPRALRHHASSDSDDELTSDKDADHKMDIEASPFKQCASPSKNLRRIISTVDESHEENAKDWECEHCTYLNSKQSKVCDVCCKSRTQQESQSPPTNDNNLELESSMKNMRISVKNNGDSNKKGREKQEEQPIKSISTGTSPPPQTTSTQTYDIPNYSGKRNRSLSCDDYSDWNPAKKTNSIVSSGSGQQSSSFQPDSSQSSEYIHSLLQNHVKHGAEIVKLLKEAELHHFELEDVTAALAQCGDENPIKWLIENWNKMIDTVVTLATNYGREQVENTIGTISSIEAQAALRQHNGDIWAAVTECIRQRQTKYSKLMSKGLYSREDVVTVLTANHGNLETAYKELSKSQLKPFLMKIWGPPQGLDNDSGDISKLHNKDYERETDDSSSVELPNDKRNFNRIQSWLDTVATPSEFDEFIHFENVLTNLRGQYGPYNCETLSPRLREQQPRNLGAFQNEKLPRHNSSDNLKLGFDILNRKKFYASTDVLNVPEAETINYKLQFNHSEISDTDGKDRMIMDFVRMHQPHHTEPQYLIMNNNSKRNAVVQNAKINGDEMECFLENYRKNYLNREYVRRGDLSNPHFIHDQVAKHQTDPSLIRSATESVSATDCKWNEDANTVAGTVSCEFERTPIRFRLSENGEITGLKSDPFPTVEISQLSTWQNNSHHFLPGVNLSETDKELEFDLENKFVPPTKFIPLVNHVANENGAVFKHVYTNHVENTLKSSTKRIPEYENIRKILDDSTKKNDFSKSEQICTEFYKENNEIFTDQLHELEESSAKFVAANQKNESSTKEKFSIPQQNLDHFKQAETGCHQRFKKTKKFNIPNVISEQLRGASNSSKSLLPNEQPNTFTPRRASKQQTENAVLLSELNALYWLAKCHLDVHIIEMKDAPLHTSTTSKSVINDAFENFVTETNEIENGPSNNIEDQQLLFANPKSNSQNKIRAVEMTEPTREKRITESAATNTQIENNNHFLLHQEMPAKSTNQLASATLHVANVTEIMAEKIEIPENQDGNASNFTNETNLDKQNVLALQNESTTNAENQTKIKCNTASTITANEKNEQNFLFDENGYNSSVNQHENTGNNTTNVNLIVEQNAHFMPVKEIAESFPNPQNENPSEQNEINDNAVGDRVTMNETKECLLVHEGKVENSSSQSEISTEIEVIATVEGGLILMENENTDENEKSNISLIESKNLSNDLAQGCSDSENKRPLENGLIIHKNHENRTNDDISLSEYESEQEILQINNHRLVSTSTTSVHEKDEIKWTSSAKTENYLNEQKTGQKNGNIVETSHFNVNLNKEQERPATNVPPDKPIFDEEDFKIEHHGDDLNEIQDTLPSAESTNQLESNSVSPNKIENDATYVGIEPHVQFRPNTTESVKEKTAETANQNDLGEEYASLEVEARQFLTEGLVSTIDQAELVAQLIQLKFDRSQSIDAANECSNIHSAIVYLQQECHLCAEKFSMKQMISLLECEHKCCQECARQFFSLQVNEKSIEHCVCPFCGEPKLPQLDSDAILNYFSNLDILLKTILEPQTHELFQQKLRDRTLMQDPSFKWCSKCSFGFIADLDQKRLSCPSCKAVTCANCGKLWTKEHHGKSCEQYDKWLATQDDSNNQFVNYLEENGITCPKCDTKFVLVKGGCMHLTCTHCKYEFCSDCLKPFFMGENCKQSDYCAKLGLHAHHPRNCLFYLRDKEPGELKRLLLENNVEVNLRQSSEKRCGIQLQKETADGLTDTKCNALVEEGGLCRTHYIEYLASLIRKNKIDPVTILDLTEILQEFRRQGKSLPIRSSNSFEHEYRKHCIEIVKEEIPLG